VNQTNLFNTFHASCVVAKMDVPGHGQWALGEGGWLASCSRAAKTLTLPTPSSPCVSLPWCFITYIYLALEKLLIDPSLSRMLQAPPPGYQTTDCIVVALLKALSLSLSLSTNLLFHCNEAASTKEKMLSALLQMRLATLLQH